MIHYYLHCAHIGNLHLANIGTSRGFEHFDPITEAPDVWKYN